MVNSSSPSAIVRELVLRSADAYGLTVEIIDGGALVGVPDGEQRDYFVLRNCDHISTLFTERGRAVDSTCVICEEARIAEFSARCVLNRLRHMRMLLEGGLR